MFFVPMVFPNKILPSVALAVVLIMLITQPDNHQQIAWLRDRKKCKRFLPTISLAHFDPDEALAALPDRSQKSVLASTHQIPYQSTPSRSDQPYELKWQQQTVAFHLHY